MKPRRLLGSLRTAGRLGLVLALLLGVMLPAFAGGLEGKKYSLHGYLRERVSFNTEDPPEVEGDNAWDLSMVRSTVYLELNLFPADWVSLTFVGRGDKEVFPDYLDTLDDTTLADLEKFYDQAELREWYADFRLGKRANFRLGRQQVVWGRTDFFRGLDIIHGFDYTWRSFLEVENEELRKPLILGNLQLEVPEANGYLQLIVRPGWDDDEDIGNTYDLRGGRWANQPNKGFDFLTPIPDVFPGVPFNYHHPTGDTDDAGYGIRWGGLAGRLDYTVAYLKTLNNDPVVNAGSAIGATPFEQEPLNGFAEFIHPEVDLFGLTLAYDLKDVPVVLRTELAYTQDQPFNFGSEFLGGALPGFAGVVEKDVLRTMVAMDWQAKWVQRAFGSSRPGFFNLQFFDTWIRSFDEDDDIVDLAGYGAPKEEHSTIGTFILGWNYNNDRLNPTIAAGYDLSYGGGFFIPSVEMVWGDHWRLRLEYDMFFDDGEKDPGEIEQDTHLLGYFANNDQFYVRLTYQF